MTERRTHNNGPPPSGERRNMTFDDHHQLCLEKETYTEKLMCLKIKPLVDGQAFIKKLLYGLIFFILGSGAVGAFGTYANQVQDEKIKHNKEVHTKFEQNVAAQIEKIDVKVERLNEKFDHKFDELLDEIRKIHD